MEVSILFIGTATATMRWLMKSIKSQNKPAEFTTDDLCSNTSPRILVPMGMQSGEFIGTLTMEFLLEMPTPDAFRLLNFDVLVYVAEKIGGEDYWSVRNIINQRSLMMYNVGVGKPEKDSGLPIGLQVDSKPCNSILEFIHAVTMPTITHKAKEINDAVEAAKLAEAKAAAEKASEVAKAAEALRELTDPEAKVSEVDETNPAYSEYTFQ